MPAGYGLSLLGVAGFFAAGVADFGWHELFGIESDLEALYSPPHLLLAAGGALIVTGPLRAAWQRTPSTLTSRWRATLAVTFLLALLTFFTSELHPFVHPWAWIRFQPDALEPAALGLPPLPVGGVGPRDLAATLGIGGFVIQSALLTGLILLLIRRWGATLPFGWLTTMLTATTAGLSIFHWTPWTIPVALVSGVAGDALYRWLQPAFGVPGALRWLTVSIPTIMFGVYFVALFLQGGTWWAPHLWVGAVVLSALSALLLSYVVVPPAMPRDDS